VKKHLLTAALLSMLLISALAGEQLFKSARAESNPVAEPPVITIFSPENKTYATNNITLSFNVSIGRLDEGYEEWIGLVSINEVYYLGDWQMKETYVVERFSSPDSKRIVEFSCNLVGVPEGSHNILVSANERCPDLNFPFAISFCFFH
jgi:hypothetical protein